MVKDKRIAITGLGSISAKTAPDIIKSGRCKAVAGLDCTSVFKHLWFKGLGIYTEYLGVGFGLEGWKVNVPDLNGDSYKKSVERTIENSGISKQDVDLIVPHGAGTAAVDYYEAKAIIEIFGTNVQKPLVTAFKPCIGHNLGSAALLELVYLRKDGV